MKKYLFQLKRKKIIAVVTTFHSDRAKPFVKKYKFVKGFEDGNLDFQFYKN